MLIEIQLLGRFAVRQGGVEVAPSAFGGRQARKLLRVLTTERGAFVSRDRLADAIWADRLPADPAGGLSVLVRRARHGLGDPSLIITGPGGYWLSDTGRCRVDAETFLEAVEAGCHRLAGGQASAALASFRSALEGWTGEPLAEDAYDDWAQDYRRQLERARLQALEGAAMAALALGRPEEATAWATQMITCQPLQERPYLLAGRVLLQAGDNAAAAATLEALRDRLATDLGMEPSQEAAELRSLVATRESLPPPPLVDPASTGKEANLELIEVQTTLEGLIVGQGTAPERSVQLAKLAVLRGPDGHHHASQLVELALVEAGADLLARSHALAAGAMVDAQYARLEQADARWAEVEAAFEALGASGMTAAIREMTPTDALDMLDHLSGLFGMWREAMSGGPAPSHRGPGLVFTGSPNEALAEIDAALEVAGVVGDQAAVAAWHWHRSEALRALGRHEEALNSARDAAKAAELLEWGACGAEVLHARGQAAEASGDRDAAEQSFLAALGKASGSPVLSSQIVARLAAALISHGRIDDAEPYLARALFETRLLRAELALARGEPGAEGLVDEALTIAPKTRDSGGLSHLPALDWLTRAF